MTSKAEWQRRAKKAEEQVDSLLEHREELQRQVQEMAQEIERLSDHERLLEGMRKRWFTAMDIMDPRNAVSAITWNPSDFSERENQAFLELGGYVNREHDRIRSSKTMREITEVAQRAEQDFRARRDAEEDDHAEDR